MSHENGRPALRATVTDTLHASSSDEIRSEDMFQLLDQLLQLSRRENRKEHPIEGLRSCFESPFSLLAADRQILESCGLHPGDALLLSQLTDLARCCRTGMFPRQPLLNRARPAAQYLCAHTFCLPVERFYALCLDRQGRLMELLQLNEGTEDGALLSIRRLLCEVMRVQPCAIVLGHNHPAGTLSPSQEDIDCTQSVIQALSCIGIPVLDHLILTRNAAVSLRANAYIPEIRWLQQSPGSALLREWLDGADLKQAVMTDLHSPPQQETSSPSHS